MTISAAPDLTIIQPGEGRSGTLGTIGVDFKFWGADTGGTLSVVEHPFPVGALVPAHLHAVGIRWNDREDHYARRVGVREGR